MRARLEGPKDALVALAISLCAMPLACKKDDGLFDPSSEVASIDAVGLQGSTPFGAELAPFGAAVAWLHGGGVSIVEASGEVRTVYRAQPGDELSALVANDDTLFFARNANVRGRPTSLMRYVRAAGPPASPTPMAEPIAAQIPPPSVPNGGASPTSAMVAYRGHLLYCDATAASRTPLIAVDVDAQVTAEARSAPQFTKVLTLGGAQCDRLAIDSTHLYLETTGGLVRLALTELDAFLDDGRSFVPAKTEVVFAATDADLLPGFFGLGATEAHVYLESKSEPNGRVLSVPKAGGPSRVEATVPKGGGDRQVSQHWLTGTGEPTIYFVDETRNASNRLVAQEPRGERELVSLPYKIRLRAVTLVGDRLLFVELPRLDNEPGRMSLRELRR